MDSLEERYLVARLIVKEIAGSLEEEERAWIEEWKAASAKNRREHERIIERLQREAGPPEQLDVEREWVAFERACRRRRGARRWRRGVAAAAIMGGMMMGGYHYLRHGGDDALAPGIVKRHVAMLVLDDGKRVMISDSSRGVVSASGGVQVVARDHRLQYEKREEPVVARHHTVIVPRGGEYELLLSDGTRVWLNSESRVTFPVHFNGETREVEMEGEVCFDVATREQQPFVVKAREVTLRVLGTMFNVEAYPGEAVVTTLVEGSLQLSSRGRESLLRPGQQARVEGGEVLLREARAAEAIEWTRGVFNFTEASLEMILTRLARWYDVEVEYRDSSAATARFTLEIRRYDNIADVLSKIEMTGRVRFSIQGNKVFVEE
jgi:ferric-dicitrate binding protein FerR (iron transport regulator)